MFLLWKLQKCPKKVTDPIYLPAIKLVIRIEFIHFVSFQFPTFCNMQFVTTNHQTNNLVFPKFFHKFFSVKQLKKKNKLFMRLKLRDNLFWTNKKFVIFFNCWNWDKLVKKIGCLLNWCHGKIQVTKSFIAKKKIWIFLYFFVFLGNQN